MKQADILDRGEEKDCVHYVQKTKLTEYHFLLTCPRYHEIRKGCFINNSWPTMGKFTYIMSSKKQNLQLKTAKYLVEALKCREDWIVQNNIEI